MFVIRFTIIIVVVIIVLSVFIFTSIINTHDDTTLYPDNLKRLRGSSDSYSIKIIRKAEDQQEQHQQQQQEQHQQQRIVRQQEQLIVQLNNKRILSDHIEKDSEIDDYIEENLEKNKDDIWNVNGYEEHSYNDTMNTNLQSLDLMFSVWFPYYNNVTQTEDGNGQDDIFWKSLNEYNNNTIHQSIMKSFIQLICDEIDFMIMNDNYSVLLDNETTTTIKTNSSRVNEYKHYDLCHNNSSSSLFDNNEQHNTIRTRTSSTNNVSHYHSTTVLWNRPNIIIKSQSRTEHMNNHHKNNNTNSSNNVTLTWTNWIISFPILHVGDTYIQQMISNQHSSIVSQHDIVLKESILKMNEMIQLDLDVSLMNHQLDIILNDDILNKNNSTIQDIQTEEEMYESQNNNNDTLLFAYTSPIEMEWDLFYPIYYEKALLYNTTNTTGSNNSSGSNGNNGTTTDTPLPPFDPPLFTPLRIGGIILMIFTFTYTGLLRYYSIRRRNMINKRIDDEKLNNHQYNTNNKTDHLTSMKDNDRLSIIISVATEDLSSGWLSSHDSLNEMLYQSSSAIFRSSTITNTTTNIPTTTTTKTKDNSIKKNISLNDTMTTEEDTIIEEETTVHTKMTNTDSDNSCDGADIDTDEPKITSSSLPLESISSDNDISDNESCHCLDDDDDKDINDVGPLSDILKATRKEAAKQMICNR